MRLRLHPFFYQEFGISPDKKKLRNVSWLELVPRSKTNWKKQMSDGTFAKISKSYKSKKQLSAWFDDSLSLFIAFSSHDFYEYISISPDSLFERGCKSFDLSYIRTNRDHMQSQVKSNLWFCLFILVIMKQLFTILLKNKRPCHSILVAGWCSK